jgi:hypothetical protein
MSQLLNEHVILYMCLINSCQKHLELYIPVEHMNIGADKMCYLLVKEENTDSRDILRIRPVAFVRQESALSNGHIIRHKAFILIRECITP